MVQADTLGSHDLAQQVVLRIVVARCHGAFRTLTSVRVMGMSM